MHLTFEAVPHNKQTLCISFPAIGLTLPKNPDKLPNTRKTRVPSVSRKTPIDPQKREAETGISPRPGPFFGESERSRASKRQNPKFAWPEGRRKRIEEHGGTRCIINVMAEHIPKFPISARPRQLLIRKLPIESLQTLRADGSGPKQPTTSNYSKRYAGSRSPTLCDNPPSPLPVYPIS